MFIRGNTGIKTLTKSFINFPIKKLHSVFMDETVINSITLLKWHLFLGKLGIIDQQIFKGEKIDAATGVVLLGISQNSQANTCDRVSF